MQPYQDITDLAVAKALAHPIRARVLGALEGRTASPSELAIELDVPLGVMSYHVRRLERLGLITLVDRAQRRGAIQHYYRATSRPRITSATWGGTPTIVKQATIASALDSIGHYVRTAAATGGFEQAEAHLTRSPITVDDEGFHALATELDALLDRIRKIESQSKKRLAKSDHAGERAATVVLMLFDLPSDRSASGAENTRKRPKRAGSQRSRVGSLSA